MICLYYTCDMHTSHGSYEKTYHVTNLSTTYEKAVAKAKSIFAKYDDKNSQLIIDQEWELNKITRDGTSEQKPKTESFPAEPKVQEQVFPLSEKVGAVGDKVELSLGVTDAFSFEGRFGSSRCIKFVDANHNLFIFFSTSKLAYSLSVGDTLYCEAVVKQYQQDYTDDAMPKAYVTTILTKLKGGK